MSRSREHYEPKFYELGPADPEVLAEHIDVGYSNGEVPYADIAAARQLYADQLLGRNVVQIAFGQSEHPVDNSAA
jgi:hypothetical protein